MKQITEDYCSFEIAKLLKEKGFINYFCRKYYNYGPENWHSPLLDEISNFPCNHNFYDVKCYAPTHQVALKWLREFYHCHVIIEYVYKADAKLTNDYVSYCYSVENANTLIAFTQDEWYDTYEEAVEAAIKYTLENLI